MGKVFEFWFRGFKRKDFLEAGLPQTLQGVEFPDDHRLALLISPYKAELAKCSKVSESLSELFRKLNADQLGKELLNRRDENLPQLQGLVRELLAILEKANPVERILEVNSDVLGMYQYRLPARNRLFSEDPMNGEIILYWGVIGIVAGSLGIGIEDLTLVVLAHEVAHAYTHLGADIDGKRWSSAGFASSAHQIKEGLAQYYTFRVVHRLDFQAPGVFSAYEELLKNQPPAYQTHLGWIDDFTPEEVRSAMIEVRRSGVGREAEFDNALNAARERLRGHGER